jgi:hypothetical protein
MNRRKFLKGAAALSAGLAAAGPLATQGMAATQKPAGLNPVGAIVAFCKSYANTPALPDEFVECNGQTLSDAQSVFNGQAIPNLNGASAATKRFLRGSSTSGTTGGAETVCASINAKTSGGAITLHGSATCWGWYGDYWDSGSYNFATVLPNSQAGVGDISMSTGNMSILNPYYEVVYVMRIK